MSTLENTVQHMPWLDTFLPKKAMEHLWDSINNSQSGDARETLAGNISKSVWIKDKDNWFYENVLKDMLEHLLFKNSWPDYHDVYISKIKSHTKFSLNPLWVNYQKQHEFNPPHNHNSGNGFSFVVFMKIPTHWKEQHALPFSANSNGSCASDFMFLLAQGNQVSAINILLSPEDEGRILIFPAWLMHQVFPFYGTEEERITISGNIGIDMDKESKKESLKNREQHLENMEKGVASLKKMIQNEKNKTTT
jgi:hypothetical protein